MGMKATAVAFTQEDIAKDLITEVATTTAMRMTDATGTSTGATNVILNTATS